MIFTTLLGLQCFCYAGAVVLGYIVTRYSLGKPVFTDDSAQLEHELECWIDRQGD